MTLTRPRSRKRHFDCFRKKPEPVPEPIEKGYQPHGIEFRYPSVAYDLRSSKDWIEVHKYAATSEIFNGEIGELHGCRFIENVFAPILADSYANKAGRQVCAMKGTTLRSFDIPIRPKRCDHFRLRIEGEGPAKIFSICKSITRGSGY